MNNMNNMNIDNDYKIIKNKFEINKCIFEKLIHTKLLSDVYTKCRNCDDCDIYIKYTVFKNNDKRIKANL
jgi:hypothetical protein